MLSIICKIKCPPIFDVGPAGVLEARRNAQSRVEVEDFMRLRSLSLQIMLSTPLLLAFQVVLRDFYIPYR